MKEMNDKLNEQILDLASKFEKESEELQACRRKLQEADNMHLRLEQEMQTRQEALREAQERETVLLARVIRILSCLNFKPYPLSIQRRWRVVKQKLISPRSSWQTFD